MMPSLGLPELIVILVIALVVFGPKKLPEVGRALGSSIKEFKKSAKEITNDIENKEKDS
nr:twin-arginine translocase TatA/TatE family subunit [Clostridium polyendosporum]